MNPAAGVKERSATTAGIPAAGVCFLDDGGGGHEEVEVPAAGDSERGAELGRNPASPLGIAVPPAGDDLRDGVVLGRAEAELETLAEADEPTVWAGMPAEGVGLCAGTTLGRAAPREVSPLWAKVPRIGVGLRPSSRLDRAAADAAPLSAGMPLGGLDRRIGAALGRAAEGESEGVSERGGWELERGAAEAFGPWTIAPAAAALGARGAKAASL